MIYAIGDIHGQKAMLDQALDLIEQDGGKDAQIVFLGDYTDRGPDSKGVLDTLINGRDAGRNWTFIKGNHDRSFYRYVTQGIEHDPMVKSGISWINPRLGGMATLASYGVIGEPELERRTSETLETLVAYHIDGKRIPADAVQEQARSAVPQHHLDFLNDLPLTHVTNDFLFVHAGLRPGVPLDQQDVEDLLWIRGPWLEDDRDHGHLVVHGHTALDAPQHHGNRVNLDGGAGFGRPLIPAVFDRRDAWLLTPTGRQPLRP